jgi:site-specific recombinase XerD
MANRLTRDKYLTRDEVKRLLYAARTRPHVHAARDLALLAVYACAGVRASEALALRVGDVVVGSSAADPSLLRVLRLKKRARVVEEVGLPATAVRAVQAYLRTLAPADRAPDQPLFRMTRQNAWSLVKRYVRLAGLNPRYTTHSLRHARGTILYEETRDPLVVQRELGHARLDTTLIYVHVVDGTRRAAAVDGLGEIVP